MEPNFRKVSLKKGKLHIEFPYDSRIVALVGSIEGRLYNKKKKYWTVPIVHVIKVVEFLSQFNFEFDPHISEIYTEKVRQLVKIRRIKKGEFTQKEVEIFDSTKLPVRHYQKIGSGFMCVAKNCILGDAPGLGKTLQSICATKLKDAKKVLIFCPASAKITWKNECDKWIPDTPATMISGGPLARQKLWETDSTFYICNYQLLLRDLKFMKMIDWDFIIADEATDISNPSAKTTKCINSLDAKYKIALTGTPINNRIEDIWSIMNWARPDYLGTYYQFTESYCMKDKYGSINAYKNLDKLRAKLAPFVLRRLKSEVLDELPPKTYEDIYVEFSNEEFQLYSSIEEEIVGDLKFHKMFNARNLSQAMVKMTRLRQMANSMELVNGRNVSSKLNALKELLKIVLSDKNEKTIIFSISREMALILMRELEEYNPLLIAGGVSDEDRAKNIDSFNNDDVHRIMIMTSAGSRSLNLQRASSVIHYDLPWSISAATQREDRAHRMGQKSNVTIYRLLVKNSIDEHILKVLYKKKELSKVLLGQSDEDVSDVPKMTDEEFQKMFTIYN